MSTQPPGPGGTQPPAMPTKPLPSPPGAVRPRRPRPPDPRGGELEPTRTPVEIRRRTFSWLGLTAFFAALGVCSGKFFFPRTLQEPPTEFKVGRPAEYAYGVDDKWQERYRIWVVRDTEKIFVINAICTHLGCTPNWVPSANKFKCPCHGSGYDSAGVNFEGPAPRPMDRCEVKIAPDGQIQVNRNRLFLERDWDRPEARIPLA